MSATNRAMNAEADSIDDPLVYLNGAMTRLSEAKIPVLDRGFIFGDGIYEAIPVYGRKPFRADQHMARLFRSLACLLLAVGLRLLQNVDPLLRVQRQRRIREARDEFLQHRGIGRVLDLVPLDRLL